MNNSGTSGETRSFRALLMLMLASAPLAILFGGGGEAPEQNVSVAEASSPAPPTPAKDPHDYCVRRFLEPLEELAIAGAASESAAAGAGGGGPELSWRDHVRSAIRHVRDALGDTLHLDAVVATVADPLDSGLGYQFDTSLQALRLGLEHDLTDKGGRFNRSGGWLPWDDRDAPDGQKAASEGCRKVMPGLVLFRGGELERPRLRGLLLVGETPTSGVHGSALVHALELAELFDDSNARPSSELLLVAPSFSGSAYSLRIALKRWAELSTSGHTRSPRIITGTASGRALPEMLGAQGEPSRSWLPGRSVEFSATTPPESVVACRYLTFLYYRVGVGRSLGPLDDRGDIPPLSEVALLHESGTEFGSALQGDRQGCPVRAGVDIAFPSRISRLRDAYEAMDRHANQATGEEAIGRRTTLDISLREKSSPKDVEAEPSPKTTYAEDIAVSKVLTAIVRGSVRHVAIQATDVADAIFLARKIRDVAPDVRVAFFGNDVLLLHPSFRRDLLGSLVVTAYPFLGTSDFAIPGGGSDIRRHEGFTSSASEGIYNAALAARGARPSLLRDYVWADGVVLPVWISAIGAGGLVPVTLGPNNDASVRGVTPVSNHPWSLKWKALLDSKLYIADDTAFPRLFHFLFFSLALAFLVDHFLQRRTARRLSQVVMPESLRPEHDRTADLAIVRTKWELYATIRSFVLALALTYMALVYWLAGSSRSGGLSGAGFGLCLVASVVALLALAFAVRAAGRFAEDYVALGRVAGCSSLLVWLDRLWRWSRRRRLQRAPLPEASPPSRSECHDLWDRMSLPVGLARADGEDPVPPAKLSFYQLRVLTTLAFVASVAFVLLQVTVMRDDVALLDGRPEPGPAMTLMMMRSLRILNTVSPAAPTLLCLAVVYVWAVGRMARLHLAHGLSLLSPDDGIADLVSTPIRVTLYPRHTPQDKADESFTRVERRCLNSILRPITGPNYALAVAVVAFFPLVLFTLKPVSTIERLLTTCLLAAGLGLCVFLIANTLVQLVQYWLSLERLLKGVLQHRLGRALDRVAPFVRDSVDEQVARAPHDLLRLAASASRFNALMVAGRQLASSDLAARLRGRLEDQETRLRELRIAAVSASVSSNQARAMERESELGRGVIEAAREIMCILLDAWDDQLRPARPGAAAEPESGREESKDERYDPGDALAAVAFRYSKVELAWLRNAEGFVATVVALLVNRHVRQFQYFVQSLTLSALVLLLAILSYPFEPHRLMLTFVMGVVISVIALGFWIYVELDRNTLISRIAGTIPGKLTFNAAFVGRVVAWGIIPLVVLAAAQYPDLANAAFRIADPLVRALR